MHLSFDSEYGCPKRRTVGNKKPIFIDEVNECGNMKGVPIPERCRYFFDNLTVKMECYAFN